MTTGQRMRDRRKELGISADFLAEKLGVSRSTIFRYENGDIEKMPIDIIKPIAQALHTTPASLMGWEDFSIPEPKEPPTTKAEGARKEVYEIIGRMDERQAKEAYHYLQYLLDKEDIQHK